MKRCVTETASESLSADRPAVTPTEFEYVDATGGAMVTVRPAAVSGSSSLLCELEVDSPPPMMVPEDGFRECVAAAAGAAAAGGAASMVPLAPTGLPDVVGRVADGE